MTLLIYSLFKKMAQYGVFEIEWTTISCAQFFKIGANQQSHI